ncbi:MAG: dihydrofolate reductase [Gammaproteobacteria bacterium]
MLSLVVAMDRGRLIGRDGSLPWHLPDDLRRFRAITMGKPIIMGRHTHDSIGRVLPGRRNIVLSRDGGDRAPGCDVYPSLDAALASIAPSSEVMVIGGAAVYREALPRAGRIYLTEVDAELAGEVRFPALADEQWREVSTQHRSRDERHAYDYCFRILERVAGWRFEPR